jgi:predicted transcriptional regulator
MGTKAEGSKKDATELNALVAEVVSAYVANNHLAAADVPGIIGIVHQALSGTGAPKLEGPPRHRKRVPHKTTITPDYLVSLEDGRRYKTLARHLSSRGLTPDAYRARWGLPSDYPMIAATYREQRAALAKSIGLGRTRTSKGAERSTSPRKVV